MSRRLTRRQFIGASAGVAVFPLDGGDSQALQRAADDALYEAKRAGKNRVCSAAGAQLEEARAPEGAES